MNKNLGFIEQFKKRLEGLIEVLSKSKFHTCSNISSDLIRASEFADYEEGVFIGEFFESVFDNILSARDNFRTDKNEVEFVKKEITNLIKLFIKSIPTKGSSAKSDLYEGIVRVRYFASKFQIKYFREGTLKKGRISPSYVPRERIIE